LASRDLPPCRLGTKRRASVGARGGCRRRHRSLSTRPDDLAHRPTETPRRRRFLPPPAT
jgi:hypothetical protein